MGTRERVCGKLPQTVLRSSGAGASKTDGEVFQSWALAHTSEVLGVRTRVRERDRFNRRT